MNLKTINYTKLFLCILLCQTAGIIGTLFTFDAVENWYQTLSRPNIAPPNWLFGPVWISLYTFMGMSLYLIQSNESSQKKTKALIIFAVQLLLNSTWSIIFFGLKSIILALVVIILLDISVLVTIYAFYKLSKKAAMLLIPYLLWILFATILNYQFYILN